MIKLFKEWLAARKKLRAAKQYAEGYAWAWDVLAKSNGQEDPSDMIWPDEKRNSFDDGVITACQHWARHTRWSLIHRRFNGTLAADTVQRAARNIQVRQP